MPDNLGKRSDNSECPSSFSYIIWNVGISILETSGLFSANQRYWACLKADVLQSGSQHSGQKERFIAACSTKTKQHGRRGHCPCNIVHSRIRYSKALALATETDPGFHFIGLSLNCVGLSVVGCRLHPRPPLLKCFLSSSVHR